MKKTKKLTRQQAREKLETFVDCKEDLAIVESVSRGYAIQIIKIAASDIELGKEVLHIAASLIYLTGFIHKRAVP